MSRSKARTRRNLPELSLDSTIPLSKHELEQQSAIHSETALPATPCLTKTGLLKDKIADLCEGKNITEIPLADLEDEYYEFQKIVSGAEFHGKDLKHMR